MKETDQGYLVSTMKVMSEDANHQNKLNPCTTLPIFVSFFDIASQYVAHSGFELTVLLL